MKNNRARACKDYFYPVSLFTVFKKPLSKKVLGSLLLILPGYFAFAQDVNADDNLTSPLITDRPDVTESPSTVAAGILQVETGALYESYKQDVVKQEAFTFNTTLLRLGISENLELRLGWDFVEGQSRINGNKLDDVSSGFNPLLVGAKINIVKEKGLLPEIGALVHLHLPFTASRDYKPETTGVDFIFSFAHTLNKKSNLSYNLGAQWQNDSPEAAYTYSLSYGYALLGDLGMYAEVYGNLPENNKANHLWDVGMTYLISKDVQVDATVGSSITEGQDMLLSAGVSFRLPVW
ncbi:transporter [Sediminibacter sp. Hel_I_10]|uniref:transporter n=1 Tax=Sediminibacter sp. Hel_I_10 TaxID=1392490 RepID=UPI0009DFDC6B|nr:transporter [Sediminibacter sp. Hel_I_10]